MLIPRRIKTWRERHSRRALIADRDPWATKYADLQAATSFVAAAQVRRDLNDRVANGSIVTKRDHEAALAALRHELEKAADEDARRIIETWRDRLTQEHNRAVASEHGRNGAIADAASWRLRALTAENELAEFQEALRDTPGEADRKAWADTAADAVRLALRLQAKRTWDDDSQRVGGRAYGAVALPGGGMLCTLPPAGLWCSLDAGHDGPCPTRSTDEPVEVKA